MKQYTTLKNNLYLYRTANQFCPAFLWATIAVNIVRGTISAFFNITIIRLIYACFENREAFSTLLLYVAAIIAIYLLSWLMNSWYDQYFAPLMKTKLYEGAYQKLFDRAKTIALKYYDDPEFYNEFIWSMNESDTRIFKAVQLLGSFCSNLIYAASMVGVMFTLDIVVAVSILLCVALTVSLNTWRFKIEYQRDLKLNPLQHEVAYYDRVMHLAQYAKELKTTKVDTLIEQKFDETMDAVKETTWSFAKRTVIIQFIMRFSGEILFDVILVAYMAYRVMVTKTLLISEFAVFVNLTWQIFFGVNNLITNMTSFYQNAFYTDRLRRFLEIEIEEEPEGKWNLEECSVESIQVENLSFSYGQKEILKDLSFEIKAGEKVAIVGYNGAGKTTLVKLLLRLYQPDSGQILINGIPAEQFSLSSWQKSFGVIFQDHQLFAVPLNENVAMGTQVDNLRVKKSLRKSGFPMESKELLSRPITKEFDENGLALSGGQQQKIALSRVFYKDSMIQIYDEPSSALDPIVEEELNKAIITENENKTVIFISHRLSTVRLADRILFLDDGMIAEAGDHASLMAQNGKYAEMFRIQSAKYQVDDAV